LASVTAYLDSNILANWFLLYRKTRTWQKLKESERAKQSMLFHDDIRDKKYDVDFITSAWAFGELAQAAIDYTLSVRMIKEGHSLERFNKYKRNHPLSRQEIGDIRKSLEAFVQHLVKLRIEPKSLKTPSKGVQQFSLEYSLDAPDALHLALASKVCHYFLTNDEELCRKNIKEIDVLLPANFRTKAAVRRHAS
jgi:predicted nucleic acid-binding protein